VHAAPNGKKKCLHSAVHQTRLSLCGYTHQSRLSNAGAQNQPVAALQVYLLLDEFIMGGELQETSKKASLV